MSKHSVRFFEQASPCDSITFVAEIPNESAGEARNILKQLDRKTGSRAEAVIVLKVQTLSSKTGGLDESLREVFEGETFPSAMHLSLRLGFKYNAAAQALGASRRRLELERAEKNSDAAIRPEAALKNITFQYVKDLKD